MRAAATAVLVRCCINRPERPASRAVGSCVVYVTVRYCDYWLYYDDHRRRRPQLVLPTILQLVGKSTETPAAGTHYPSVAQCLRSGKWSMPSGRRTFGCRRTPSGPIWNPMNRSSTPTTGTCSTHCPWPSSYCSYDICSKSESNFRVDELECITFEPQSMVFFLTRRSSLSDTVFRLLAYRWASRALNQNGFPITTCWRRCLPETASGITRRWWA